MDTLLKPHSAPHADTRLPAFAHPRSMALDMRVALESPEQPEVIQLIGELDAYQRPLYPAASHHGVDIAALTQFNVLFAVARARKGLAIGCCAIVFHPGHAEIKQMFVRPQFRGNGAATALLMLLESLAVGRGFSVLCLETGIAQPEALAFYARAGYLQRGPFGAYAPDPLSVFMQKSVH